MFYILIYNIYNIVLPLSYVFFNLAICNLQCTRATCYYNLEKTGLIAPYVPQLRKSTDNYLTLFALKCLCT